MDKYTKKMMYLLNSRRNMGLDITDGKKHSCGLYDIIEVDDKLYRIMIGSGRTDIILEHPLPEQFWALPIYHEDEKEKENNRKEDFEEFSKIAEDFVNKYGCPHTTIIITQEGIDVSDSRMGKSFVLRG